MARHQRVKASPLTIAITPVGRLRNKRVEADRVRGLPAVVLSGMAHLMSHSDRPQAFTDDALARARDLAQMTAAKLACALYSDGTSVDVTHNRCECGQDSGAAYRGYGTVEGRLEAINIHVNEEFAIYDDLTDRRIECFIRAPLTG